MKEKILLYACCAPCSAYPIKKLQEDFEVEILFYAPNIHPESEYLLRLEEIEKFCKKKNIKLYKGEYEKDLWFKLIEGYENEKEGGKRCDICFEMRLDKAAKFAKENGFKYFCSSLSISPHKNIEKIEKAGEKAEKSRGAEFLNFNFKKNDGFKKSCEISKKENFYRQNYCGCIFSMKKDKIIEN